MHTTTTRFVLALLAVIVLVTSTLGCGVMRPVRGRREVAAHTGFLGDYSELQKREGYDAQEIYINPATDWTNYRAVFIDAVTLWVHPGMKLSDEDQQMLTDMLYESLHEKLSEKLTVVDRAEPGVLSLRFALSEAKGANVPMNTITTVIPQARMVSTVAGVSTDTAALVGSAAVEGEARDSITNERLAAVVDSRAGTKGVTRMLGKWNDVEAIFDYWGERVTEFFVKQGVRAKAP
jgi:hypothetical protein